MPVSVRLLSKFARLGASSRVRMLQYLPILNQLGIAVDHYPLLSDEYVKALYEGKLYASRMLAGRHYVNRVREMRRKSTADLDWLEGEYLPFVSRGFEKFFMNGRRPFVVEYDDALFHRYELSSSGVVRSVLGKKIDAVMRDAACVIAGNRYLAEHALHVGAERVEIIPTAVDVAKYVPVMHRDRSRLVIGWIGSPVTQHYLHALHGALREVCLRHNAVLRLIGAHPNIVEHLPGIPLECVPWTEQGEANLLAEIDVGIMPLLDGPFERGKCGYKLIQYMASGLPVLASPIGVNSDLVRAGVNGFLPVSSDDWVETLSLLLSSADERQRLGMAGRSRVETEFCTQIQAPRLAEIMRRGASW